MAAKKIEIKPINLGLGWEATDAWVTGGPVILIQATSSTGTTVKSRFDMQKSMFIDPLPEGVETKKEDLQHLVKALNAAADISRW